MVEGGKDHFFDFFSEFWVVVPLVFFLVSVYLIQYSFQVLDFVVDLIDRFPGREFVKKIIYVPVIMRNFKIATFSIVKFSGKLN